MNFEPTKTFLLKKWSECHWDEFSKLIRKVFVILLSCLLTCFCNFLKAFEKIECLDSGDFDFKWIERLFHPSIFVNRVLSNLYICNMKYHVKEIRSDSMFLVGTLKCQCLGRSCPYSSYPCGFYCVDECSCTLNSNLPTAWRRLQEVISGQSYKQFTLVIYDSRVVIWGIFKSGTTLGHRTSGRFKPT